MNVVQFKGQMNRIIDLKVADTLASKDPKHQFLTYWEFQNVTGAVRNVFLNSLEIIPCQIEGACKMAEAVLAPDAATRNDLIKSAAAITGAATGVAATITGIGMGLGWGAGAISTAITFFTGVSLATPVGTAVAGISLALISGYFFFKSDEITVTAHAINALKGGLEPAIDAIWLENKSKLENVGCNNAGDDTKTNN